MSLQDIKQLEDQASRWLAQGNAKQAVLTWQKILTQDANHANTLMALGQHCLRTGEFKAAAALFGRLTTIYPAEPDFWIHLSMAQRQLNDSAAEAASITSALRHDPSSIVALYLRANLQLREGNNHAAALTFGALASVAPPLNEVEPELRPAVQEAMKYRDQYNLAFSGYVRDFLAEHSARSGAETSTRFNESLDIMVGKRRRYVPQPSVYYFPGLPTIEFFDRSHFPWLEELEAQTSAIRSECEAVLVGESGFTPYIAYGDDLPDNQFAALNHSTDWNAFHFYYEGKPNLENVARCPNTVAAWEKTPRPMLPERTPAAMFSVLKPRTHIPAHSGVTNVRLVTHLPLIVPEKCRFRVGNQTREWVPGQAWVFDDTIDHEAWNDSDQTRAVFIFDTWHPLLTPSEREMVGALIAGMNQFRGETVTFGL